MIQIVCPYFLSTTFRIMQAATKTTSLLRIARKGPLRARDLDDAGVPRAYLKRLCDRGLLEQVDRGLYRLANAPVTELSSLAEVGKRVPHAVIGLLSALQVHGMTSEAPHAVWMLIDRHARTPKVTPPEIGEVGKRVPHAVIGLLSALQVHGMTSEVPHAVWVLIDRHARTPKVTSP